MSNRRKSTKSFQDRLAERNGAKPEVQDQLTGFENVEPGSLPDMVQKAVLASEHFWVMTQRFHMTDEALVAIASADIKPDVMPKTPLDASMTCVLCASPFTIGLVGTVCTRGFK